MLVSKLHGKIGRVKVVSFVFDRLYNACFKDEGKVLVFMEEWKRGASTGGSSEAQFFKT